MWSISILERPGQSPYLIKKSEIVTKEMSDLIDKITNEQKELREGIAI
jgi:hypothetical protein